MIVHLLKVDSIKIELFKEVAIPILELSNIGMGLNTNNVSY